MCILYAIFMSIFLAQKDKYPELAIIGVSSFNIVRVIHIWRDNLKKQFVASFLNKAIFLCGYSVVPGVRGHNKVKQYLDQLITCLIFTLYAVRKKSIHGNKYIFIQHYILNILTLTHLRIYLWYNIPHLFEIHKHNKTRSRTF